MKHTEFILQEQFPELCRTATTHNFKAVISTPFDSKSELPKGGGLGREEGRERMDCRSYFQRFGYSQLNITIQSKLLCSLYHRRVM